MKELYTTYNTVNIKRYDEISSYHDIREQLDRLSGEFRSFLTQPEYLVPFLQPGRLVKVYIYLLQCISAISDRIFNLLVHIAGEKRV